MSFGPDRDEPDWRDIDGDDNSDDTDGSKYCLACGSTTTVSNGEAKYCGECGRAFNTDSSRGGSGF